MTERVNPFKRRKLNNYKFAFGMGMNWCDYDKGLIYHIQDYKEALDRGEKPEKIKITKMDGETIVGWKSPEAIENDMADPIPDPKYAAETPREIMRELRRHD